jgi:hypothetical protein
MSAAGNTAAARVRARRDPAILAPPPRPKGSRTSSIRNLHLKIAGRVYPIGANVEGDTPWEMTMEGAATVTVPVRSPDDSLAEALGDEAQIQRGAVTMSIDDIVYVLSTVSSDDTGLYTLSFEDEVAWRLKQFSKFMAATRKTYTRALFAQRLVDEASRKPLKAMRSFIPELGDRQRILAPTKA